MGNRVLLELDSKYMRLNDWRPSHFEKSPCKDNYANPKALFSSESKKSIRLDILKQTQIENAGNIKQSSACCIQTQLGKCMPNDELESDCEDDGVSPIDKCEHTLQRLNQEFQCGMNYQR